MKSLKSSCLAPLALAGPALAQDTVQDALQVESELDSHLILAQVDQLWHAGGAFKYASKVRAAERLLEVIHVAIGLPARLPRQEAQTLDAVLELDVRANVLEVEELLRFDGRKGAIHFPPFEEVPQSSRRGITSVVPPFERDDRARPAKALASTDTTRVTCFPATRARTMSSSSRARPTPRPQ